MPPVKVLIVVGAQRSGSTLLHRILGQIDSFVAVGELWYLWEQGLLENRLCGCGGRFRECAFWTRVFEMAFGGLDAIEAERMRRAIRFGSRTRNLPLYWAHAGKRHVRSRLVAELKVLGALYRAVHASTGSRVIVDSSKSPGYAQLLSLIPDVELYVVHLIRDSRAVAYSWQRRKLQLDKGTQARMSTMSPVKSAVLWNIWNTAAERLQKLHPARYAQLRYEDLVAHPQTSIERIVSMTGTCRTSLSFINGNKVRLDRTHTISGNPNRFRSGDVELRADEEWRNAIAGSHHRIVTSLTRSLLAKYGYLKESSGILSLCCFS